MAHRGRWQGGGGMQRKGQDETGKESIRVM